MSNIFKAKEVYNQTIERRKTIIQNLISMEISKGNFEAHLPFRLKDFEEEELKAAGYTVMSLANSFPNIFWNKGENENE